MSDLVFRAATFAAKSHAGQTRKYANAFGVCEAYINHPARVAAGVATIFSTGGYGAPSTEAMMAAAWCHDVLEDCDVLQSELTEATDKYCTYFVQELTNPSKTFSYLSRTKRKEMDREHIRFATNEAKTIKALDRMDNIMSLVNAPPDFVRLYLNESRLLADCLNGAYEGTQDKLIQMIDDVSKIFLTPGQV